MRIGCSRSLIVFALVPVVVALGRSRLLYLSPPASTSGRSSEPDQTAAALSSSLLVEHRRTKGRTPRKTFRRPVYRFLRDTLWVGAIVSERVAARSVDRPAAARMPFHGLPYLDSFGVFHHMGGCFQYHRDRFTRFLVNVRCKFTCAKLRGWQPNRRFYRSRRRARCPLQ